MKKLIVLCAVMISAGLFLTGCANPFDHMPDLSEEDSALVAEYISGLLQRYNTNTGKLANDQEIVTYDERQATIEKNTEALLAAKKEDGEEAGNNGAGASDEASQAKPAQTAPASFEGIAQYCGLDSFQITYAGHLVCDSYPPEEEFVFAADATPGNKLLVLRFTVHNQTQEEQLLDMMNGNVSFGISVNDGEMKHVMPSILPDDLAIYKGMVPAGQSMELVLVREVTQEEAGSISTISLSMSGASGEVSTVLE